MPEIVHTFWTQCKNAAALEASAICAENFSGHHTAGVIFLFGFNVISQKKKCFVWVLQVFFALRTTYKSEALWTAAVYDFWHNKKCRNSQQFSGKMTEKNLHFFALIGNTGYEIQKSLNISRYFYELKDLCLDGLAM